MRALVTGASGLLGTWLLRMVPEGVNVIASTRRSATDGPQHVRADLRNGEQALRLVETARPDVILHAAYDRNFDSIVTVTANLAEAARSLGADMVMLSTDAVFNGDGISKSEDDAPDPVWEYGQWKVRAEHAVLATDPDATVVRAPLLVSLDPPDRMVQRVSEAARRGDTVGWYTGERRQPAYAADVAEALWTIVGLAAQERRGIWHLPGPEVLTRRELGARIARALHVDDPGTEVMPDESRPHAIELSSERAKALIRWHPKRVLLQTSP